MCCPCQCELPHCFRLELPRELTFQNCISATMPHLAVPLRPSWASLSQAEFRETLSQLTSLRDLARFWGIKPSQLSYYAFHIDKRDAYKSVSIPRRNGTQRQLDIPNPSLRYLQRLLHESLTRIYGPHRVVHGFLSERSIVTNAQRHLGSRFILNVDLMDFFPSIHRKRIYGRLTAPPYSLQPEIANIVASLATNVFSQLPQGSPSSPVIANIITSEMDKDLADLCSSLYCRYTRYADDITISTSRFQLSPHIARYPKASGTGQVIIGDRLRHIIEQHGFDINNQKSRLQSHWTRQMCTGLVVNADRVSIPRPYVRRLRSLIDHWQKDGWEGAAQILHSQEHRKVFGNRQAFVNHVLGRIAYLKMIRGQDDSTYRRLASIVASIPELH